ncbi:sensor histidine kinase [Lapillicoccus jejuensis]|uniref:Two-component system LytT family sensor kinase n=1 Tax=Lapillicoccus jejuensis TaxID=402171 RepID=A0A542DXR2_9MICO|nr:histidine kinase [Lapillicoccus jejuensis]TQJ07882.1 two-component system LytT family sensor kinase [Lapillicoccus jejuensis]
MTLVAVAVVVTVVVLLGVGAVALLRRRRFVDEVDRATYETLHTASVAARHLRGGLTPDAAARAARQLRPMLGSRAIALTDPAAVLAWDGTGSHHRGQVVALAAGVLAGGATTVLGEEDLACGDPDCPIRSGVVAPVTADERVVGALAAYGPSVSPGLVRATEELAGWISTQVELSELERQRSRLMEAELRALRAQISPHFVYNCLSAIGSFVRTDPDRARELVLEFADFTRYAFRRGGAYTTLRDELRNIERYLVLEQARFGERLVVQLTIAPEVLPVAVPFLSVQPLVENAVRHGLERKPGVGHVTITAADTGQEAEITIEDDGVGSDPDAIRAVLAGESEADSVGLGNVDARLRQAYGDRYGLVVETAPGAGTRVVFRVPKFAPGVHAQP